MDTSLRWTSADLEALPDDGTRYEIIEGELYVSKVPHWHHQQACAEILTELKNCSRAAGRGEAIACAGLIFSPDNDVIPDVIWISEERLQTALKDDGHLHSAPELAVEVLSPGWANEKRDREAKLGLYSRRSVDEYWIVDWQQRSIDIYRRVEGALVLKSTLSETGILTTPLLPGFSCAVATLFERIPR